MTGIVLPRTGSPDLRPFTHSLPMALLRAREATMRWFRPHLATHGLTEQRWRVLRALTSADGPLDVGQVAERTFLLAPSLSRILADLEGLGLVHRAADTVDRRRTLLSLTDDGQRLVTRVAPESESIYGRIEERFGAERLDVLLADLRDLEDVLAEIDGVGR